ncbi:MAG: hypothetical protein ACJ758_03845 [Actinomycetota bacterium]
MAEKKKPRGVSITFRVWREGENENEIWLGSGIEGSPPIYISKSPKSKAYLPTAWEHLDRALKANGK